MATSNAWRRVKINEAKQLVQREDITIFDMRDEMSYGQEHIAGARYLSNANLEEAIMTTPRDKPVLIYCYHGNASQSGAQMFADFGFREVYDLVGGYEDWRKFALAATAECA